MQVRFCVQLEDGYSPSITFVVVQKRHHTRVFPNSPRDAERSGNVMPGELQLSFQLASWLHAA